MSGGAFDTNGIWIYGEDDPASPVSDLLNLGQEATSAAFADDRTRLDALETPDDTGWVGLTSIDAAWDAPSGGSACQLRQIGNQVRFRGLQRNDSGVIAAGTYNIGTIPTGMRPPVASWWWVPGWVSGGTNLQVLVQVATSGVVTEIVPGNTTGIYMSPVSYWTT